MKKILALVLTLTMAIGLLAGCGAQNTEPAESTEPAATEETTAAETGDLQKIVITEQVRGYHWAPVYLAQSLGYFEEQGLEAEFQTIKGSDATAPVLSGDAQFCLKGVESALMVNEAAEDGQGTKIVLSTSQKYPYQLVGTAADYTTLESLKGATVAGGQSANSGPFSFAKAALNSAGLTPDTDVSVITMASSGYAAAIQAGEIQAAVSTNPWAAKKLVDAGGTVIVDGTDDATIEGIIGSASYELFVLMTSDQYIAENPETVQKVVTAVAKAVKWMNEASAEDIAENLQPLFDGAAEGELLYDAQYDKEHQVATTDGYHTESGFQAALELTKLAGGITADQTAEQTYDESFLDKAWEELGK